MRLQAAKRNVILAATGISLVLIAYLVLSRLARLFFYRQGHQMGEPIRGKWRLFYRG